MPRRVFYGLAQWKAHRSPVRQGGADQHAADGRPDGRCTSASATGATPAHLSSGIARIDANGHATWITARGRRGQPDRHRRGHELCPGPVARGRTVYIIVTTKAGGILVGLNAATLRPRFHVTLKDPVNGKPAVISQLGPPPRWSARWGRVLRRLGNPLSSHDIRGWLPHYNSNLTREKIPGSFGGTRLCPWCPLSAVPSYHGSSPYLLVSKYDNYIFGRAGKRSQRSCRAGSGVSQKDPLLQGQDHEVQTSILSPDQSPGRPPARYEWCMNSAVVDTADDSVFVNSEDGILYRWDLATIPWRRNPPKPRDARATRRRCSAPTAPSTPSTTATSTPSAASTAWVSDMGLCGASGLRSGYCSSRVASDGP